MNMNKLLAALLAGVFAATLSISAFAADDMAAPAAAAPAAEAAPMAAPMKHKHKAHKSHKSHKAEKAMPAPAEAPAAAK